MTSDDPNSRDGSLLVPTRYDDDNLSLRTLSDQDSDSEDDELQQGAQTSLELNQHDLSVLREEEEREKLLVEGSTGEGLRRIFSGGLSNSSKVKIGKRDRRKKRRREQREERRARKQLLMEGKGEEGEMMVEMEEGVFDSDEGSYTSESSSELDRRKYRDGFGGKSSTSKCVTYTIIFAAIIVLFFIILLVAYQLSRKSRAEDNETALRSNGTDLFAATTILISLDGFRADFLQRDITPTLNRFKREGISPRYMLPSFPSVTFPNHFTLVTGLYPESHGVVGNTFWDPDLKQEFYYTDPKRSMDPKWWNGEPLWVTAEKAGIKSAIHMWPGSEAHIGGIEPTYLDKYNGDELLSNKVDRILELLDLPGPADEASIVPGKRPQLIAAYVPNVDADGHNYGPNSTEIDRTIRSVDTMLENVFQGLEARNLTRIVNVVVVSDHGMATTSTDRLIQLDDLIDMDLVEHTDGWPLYGLRPKNPIDLRGLHDRLWAEAQNNPNFDVYLRDADMPERYHFSNNSRIAPLWIVPKTGWAIVVKKEFDIAKAKEMGDIYHPRGLHGYDHEHPLMRAIFVARGPAFPHEPNSRVEVFQNTEVYNIVCDSISVSPKPNNGTLRLPLKPVGLHTAPEPVPSDPTETPPLPANLSTSSSIPQATPGIGVDDPGAGAPERPTVLDDGDSQVTDDAKSKLHEWLHYFKDKVKGVKNWITNLLPGKKKDDEKGEA
ncbi:MAG: ectonucleotide pyrophosphatase phosphodiesterase [Vezdaea aestivalis]|nr:MAG: ectonucleotide pyrophosphatase phosphodiesterase [Vezdaea aestivalis]